MNTLARPVPDSAADAGQTSRPLRILHVLDHSLPLHSGYTFRTLSILRQQRAMGWQTIHLTGPKQGRVEQAMEHCDGWDFHRTAPAEGLLSRVPVVRHRALMDALRGRLDEVVRAVRPDILHAHSPVLDALPTLAVGRKYGLPVVYEVRAFWEDAAADLGTAREWGLRYRLTRAMETRALRRADAVTTICEGLRGDMLARGIAADKITVIPNAVDVERFEYAEAADAELMRRHGLSAGKTLGFAGSFYAYEGLDVLLEAMPGVLARLPEARVLLVGGGPMEVALKARAEALGISHAVHFTGRVPHAQVGRYYSVMDLMVYPRKSRRLTDLVTPLKPLEAMAMGKRVLASDVGGHRELVRDGYNGHLFPAGDSTALAERLLALLGDGCGHDAVLAQGRRYVEDERNWALSCAPYRAIYERLLAARAGTAR